MILIKSIKLNNFLSHFETEIPFKDNEKLLLDGKSGAGKTAITEAILFALFGRGRSDNKNLIRKGQKLASVSLKLIDGVKETIITRSITDKGKNTLTITQNTGGKGQFLPIERTGLKDHDDWIQKTYLRSSFELFTNSIVYTQDGEESFVKANASKRKDLLLEIIGAEDFTLLYEKTRKQISVKETENAINLTKIEGLESTIKNSEILVLGYDNHKKKYEDASTSIDSLVEIEKGLETKITNSSSIVNQISDKKKMQQMLLTSIIVIDTQLETDQKSIEDHKKIDIAIHRKNITEVDILQKEVEKIEKELKESALAQQKINAHLSNKPMVFDYSLDIEAINKRLIPLIKETGKCPAGDLCPFVKPIQGQIDFLTEQITEKSTKSITEQDAFKKWEKQLALLPIVKDITETYKTLKDIKDKILVLSFSKDILVKYDAFEKDIGILNAKDVGLEMQKIDHNNNLLSIVENLKELEKQLNSLDINNLNIQLSKIRITIAESRKTKEQEAMALTMVDIAKSHIKTSQEELEGLRKAIGRGVEDTEALELLKEALSPRGIKAVVIDYLVPQLEERINTVLGQMSDFRIRLDTQQPLASEEGLKEGLFITVINDRKEELPFASYSGGEKVKITIAISEALASLMNQIGFRIMDENIVSLDRESTEGFVTVLTKLQEKFPQLLVISHLQEVKDMFEKQVMITKVNGVSKIV